MSPQEQSDIEKLLQSALTKMVREQEATTFKMKLSGGEHLKIGAGILTIVGTVVGFFWNYMKENDARMASVENKGTSIAQSIDDVKASVGDVKDDVKDVRGDIKALSGKVGELAVSVGEIRGRRGPGEVGSAEPN